MYTLANWEVLVDLPLFIPEWRERVVFSAGGPQPQVLHEDDKIKVVVAGLKPGGEIPVHPGDAGVYHFLEGEGDMAVADKVFEVKAGSTVIVPAGATRGMKARAQLAFIAVRIA
jgi:mannose-6-phosphate isomerase-like protein (cupin superfamily)